LHIHHVRMVSEGSCDAEGWKIQLCITGINYISRYIQIETNILN